MLVADGYMEFLYSAGTVVGINHPLGTYRGVDEFQLDSISIQLGGLSFVISKELSGSPSRKKLGLRTWITRYLEVL